jgi:thiamine biosynthesis lipoprotein
LYRYCIIILCGLICCQLLQAQPRKFYFSKSKMGSPFNLVLVSDDSSKADLAARQAYALVDSFNQVFSDYDPNSELSRLNATAGTGSTVKLSPALWDILMLSRDAYRNSAGAFDITIGSLSRLWRKARAEKVFAAKDSVLHYRKRIGFDQLLFDTSTPAVQLSVAGMYIDLGGIAKGYIAQKVIDRLKELGITQALADAGGDIAMSDAPLSASGWNVGVNIPGTTDDLLNKKLVLYNASVATSGDAYQYLEHAGRKYSHIIDPRTGYGVLSQRNVTVIAKNGALADWLATACSILPIGSAKKLATRYGAALLIGMIENGKPVYHSNQAFARYWQK